MAKTHMPEVFQENTSDCKDFNMIVFVYKYINNLKRVKVTSIKLKEMKFRNVLLPVIMNVHVFYF